MSTTTVTATYLDPAGNPCKGRVVFRLVAATYQDGLDAIFPTVPIHASLNASGVITVELEPTSGDDASFDATDMTYQVWERINGTDRAPYYVDIPTASSVDLGTLQTYDDPPAFVRQYQIPDLTDLGFPQGDDVVYKLTSPLLKATATRLFTIAKPADDSETHGPHTLVRGGTTFNGTWDPVLYFGYNVDAGAVPVLAGEPTAAWIIEADYNDGAKHTVEIYNEVKSVALGYTVRPYFAQINRATGTGVLNVDFGTTSGAFGIGYSTTSVAVFQNANIEFRRPLVSTATNPSLSLGDHTADNDSGITLDVKSGYADAITFQVAGTSKWKLYTIGGDGPFYLRDMVNSKMHATFTAGAGDSGGITKLNSAVIVYGTWNGIGVNPSLTMGDGTQTNDAALTVNAASGYSAVLQWGDQTSGGVVTNKWKLYKIYGDSNLYLRDMVNSLMHVTYTPGSGTSGVTALAGALKVGGSVGFYGTTPAVKPTVSGAKGSNAALGSLLTALAGLGLITDSSSA